MKWLETSFNKIVIAGEERFIWHKKPQQYMKQLSRKTTSNADGQTAFQLYDAILYAIDMAVEDDDSNQK